MDTDENIFGKRLREYRQYKTQAAMAELFDITAGYYGELERGIKLPNYGVLKKIIEKSGRDANYWFGIDSPSIPLCAQKSNLEKKEPISNSFAVDRMNLDTLSLFFRDRIKDEIDTVKESTFDCIQENIEELYILLKKEKKKEQGKSA